MEGNDQTPNGAASGAEIPLLSLTYRSDSSCQVLIHVMVRVDESRMHQVQRQAEHCICFLVLWRYVCGRTHPSDEIVGAVDGRVANVAVKWIHSY